MCFISASCDPTGDPAHGDGSWCQGPCLFGFFSSLLHLTEISLTVQRHGFPPQDSPSDNMSSWLCFPAAHWLAERWPPDSRQHSGRELNMLAALTSFFLMMLFEETKAVFMILEKVVATSLIFNPDSLEKHACGKKKIFKIILHYLLQVSQLNVQ